MQNMIGSDIRKGLVARGMILTDVQFRQLSETIKYFELDSDQNFVGPYDCVLDAFCSILQEKLKYLPGERDMVVMHHEFGIQWNSREREKRTSTMIAYGNAEYSAMARTVGFPAAMGTDMLLRNEIMQKGVFGPLGKEIYEPIIKKLEMEGIQFTETSTKL
jgi:alpha-aminoadipic semialdehyde synthase